MRGTLALVGLTLLFWPVAAGEPGATVPAVADQASPAENVLEPAQPAPGLPPEVPSAAQEARDGAVQVARSAASEVAATQETTDQELTRKGVGVPLPEDVDEAPYEAAKAARQLLEDPVLTLQELAETVPFDGGEPGPVPVPDPPSEPPTPDDGQQAVEEVLELIPQGNGSGGSSNPGGGGGGGGSGSGHGGGGGGGFGGLLPQATFLDETVQELEENVGRSKLRLPHVPAARTPRVPAHSAPAPDVGPASTRGPSMGSSPVATIADSRADAGAIQISVPLMLAGTGVVGAAASGMSFWPAGRRWTLRLLGLMAPSALYTRLTEERLLGHPKRALIHEFIRQNPGERMEVARKLLGLTNGTMMHHLRLLEQGRLVRLRREGRMVRMYLAGPMVPSAPYVPPRRRQILDLLRSQPGLTQRQIAGLMRETERVVSYHVRCLQRQGLMTVERRGTTHLCYPAPTSPSALG